MPSIIQFLCIFYDSGVTAGQVSRVISSFVSPAQHHHHQQCHSLSIMQLATFSISWLPALHCRYTQLHSSFFFCRRTLSPLTGRLVTFNVSILHGNHCFRRPRRPCAPAVASCLLPITTNLPLTWTWPVGGLFHCLCLFSRLSILLQLPTFAHHFCFLFRCFR